MPIPFDISTHALLTDKVTGGALTAHTRIAERVLGLYGVTFSASQEEEIEAALALQVNFQYERGVEADTYQEIKDGAMWSIYNAVPVSMLARFIVQSVILQIRGIGARPPTVSLR